MAQKTTWILVCDASRAQLFEERPPGRDYSLVATFVRPQSRARVTDLTTDAHGRKPVGSPRGGSRAHPGGFHGRPGAEAETDAKEVEAQKFARDLADALQKGLDDHAYEALVLAAPPRFLGLMKSALGEQVQKRLEATIAKDLSPFAPRALERKLRAERAA